MTFTIDSTDSRSIKAIEIAAQAGQWLKVTLADGSRVWGVPSQRDPSHVYFVSLSPLRCTCEDFQRNGLTDRRVGMNGEHGLCKHLRAAKLHHELTEATQDRTRGGTRRHLHLVPQQTVSALAQRYTEIFGTEEN